MNFFISVALSRFCRYGYRRHGYHFLSKFFGPFNEPGITSWKIEDSSAKGFAKGFMNLSMYSSINPSMTFEINFKFNPSNSWNKFSNSYRGLGVVAATSQPILT